VTTSIVVGGILLSADQQLGVEQLAVGASADLVDRRGIQVDKDGAGHVFAAAGLGEEGLERAGVGEVLRIGVRTTICLETVLKQVQLPGTVTQLGSRLTYVQVTDLAAHVVRLPLYQIG